MSRVTIAERLLLALSSPSAPARPDPAPDDAWSVNAALAPLRKRFPDFDRAVAGRRVLDTGCGEGNQSVALALALGCQVVGVEPDERRRATARQRASSQSLQASRVSFVASIDEVPDSAFDVVLSQDSFEHFAEPERMLEAMAARLRPGGRLLVTFGPPWLAPYGSHMYFFCRVPWVNLLFSERTVLAVRSRFRDDGARRYEDVEQGLNRMTVGRFESIVAGSGLETSYERYDCVRGWNALGRLPGMRELFINNVTVVLSRRRAVDAGVVRLAA